MFSSLEGMIYVPSVNACYLKQVYEYEKCFLIFFYQSPSQVHDSNLNNLLGNINEEISLCSIFTDILMLDVPGGGIVVLPA